MCTRYNTSHIPAQSYNSVTHVIDVSVPFPSVVRSRPVFFFRGVLAYNVASLVHLAGAKLCEVAMFGPVSAWVALALGNARGSYLAQ
jgi:hypothetical protein